MLGRPCPAAAVLSAPPYEKNPGFIIFQDRIVSGQEFTVRGWDTVKVGDQFPDFIFDDGPVLSFKPEVFDVFIRFSVPQGIDELQDGIVAFPAADAVYAFFQDHIRHESRVN